MKNRRHIPRSIKGSRWLRLIFSITLAMSFALVLLLIPVTAGTTMRITVPVLSQLEPVLESLPIGLIQNNDHAIDLSFSFGPALVHATNGLTITKTAPPTVNQGDILTYTLTVRNETGQALTDALITDTVAANATCVDIINPVSPPAPFWTSSCNTVALWDMLYVPSIPFLSISFTNNTSNVFTYSVAIDEPLPDQFEIINSNYTITSTNGAIFYSDTGIPVTTKVNAPNWVISKTVSSDTIQPGDYLTYTITIINDGHLETEGAYTVTDVLPGNTVFTTTKIQPPGARDEITLTWVLTEPLAALGGTKTLTYAVQVTSPLTDGEVIVNQIYNVTGGNVYSSASGLPITTTVDSPATLVITKTASPDPVQAGDLLTYTITITNDTSAKGPAFGVIISDTLPGEVLYQSAGFVGTASGTITDTGNPTILWQLTDPLAVGDSAQVTVTVRVTSPLVPGLITNTFAASATNASLVSDTITTEVTSTNIITLSKSVDPAVVAPGDTVTYTITLTNTGNSIATINLTDVLHVGFTPPAHSQFGLTLPGRSLSTSGTVTTTTFTATTPITPGIYHNHVVTATYDLTQTTISNIAPVQVVSAGITITKVANVSTADVGDTITYTYTITNMGNITLTDITLTDDLLGAIVPATTTLGPTLGTTGAATTLVTEADLVAGAITNTVTVTGTYLTDNFVTAVATETVDIVPTTRITVEKFATPSAGLPARIGDTITYTYRITNTGTVTLSVSMNDDQLGSIMPVPGLPLGPSQSTVVTNTTVVVENNLPGPLTNTVTVTGTNILAENTIATDTVSVPLTYTIGITVNKIASQSIATPGDTVTYTYQITNTGDVTLTGIIIYDDEPAASFPPLSTTLGPNQSTSGTYYRNITQTDLPGPITNTATVTGTNAVVSRTVVATDTAVVVLTYTLAISVEKTANVSNATIGDVITYTYHVTNSGNVSLANITLFDDKLGSISLPVTSLMPGFPTTKQISYTIVAGNFPGPLTNTATVSGTAFTNTITDTDMATVTLVYTPSIQLVKTANVLTAAPGDTLVYTYTVTNTGNVTLTNIVLNDDRLGPITNLGLTILPPTMGTTGLATYTVLTGDVPAITNTAKVTGEDILNQFITDVQTFTVGVEPKFTTITATNSSPNAVHETTLFSVTTNLSSGVTYSWNFGDGGSDVGQNPIYTYTTVGVYTATVTASNSVDSITATTVVTITPGPLVGFTIEPDPMPDQTAGVDFPLTITAVDAYDNRIDTVNQTITLDDATGTMLPTAVTLVNGITVTNVTVYSATAPLPDTITAISGTITGTVDVIIRPNAPTTVTVVASPTSLRVCQSAPVTVTVIDNWNNPVPGTSLEILVKNNNIPTPPPNPPFGDAVITPTSIFSSDINGRVNAYVQGTLSGNVSVLARVLPAFTPLGLTGNINFAAPPIPSAITTTVVPSTVITGGTAIVSAQVSSCAGPIDGAVVTFTIPAAYGSVSPAAAATVGGVATTTVTAGATPGTTSITATVEGPLSNSTPFTITLPTAPALSITKTANPASGDVSPGGSIIYTVVVANTGTGPAGNVMITDTLDTGLDFVNQSITSGSGSYNSGTRTVSFLAGSLAAGASVTATIETAISTSAISGTTISNTATAGSSETGQIGATTPVVHQVITRTVGPVYLPIIIKNYPQPPDLIASFSLNPPNPAAGQNVVVTVVVTNVGSASTGSGFWVDFYVEPNPVPTQANQRWDVLGSNVSPKQGIAWSSATALAPGDSIVLTSNGVGGLAPSEPHTIWNGVFYSGTNDLYVYVDSFSTNGSPSGGILESDETNNRSQLTGLGITGLDANTADRTTPIQLPPRWDP